MDLFILSSCVNMFTKSKVFVKHGMTFLKSVVEMYTWLIEPVTLDVWGVHMLQNLVICR